MAKVNVSITKSILRRLNKIDDLSFIYIFSDGSGKVFDGDDNIVFQFVSVEELINSLKSYNPKTGKAPSHYNGDKKHGKAR